MNFVAIDFETANRDPASACSLGLIVVKDGVITEQKQWLIQPPNLSFDYRHIKIHGITPELVKDAPTFDLIWEDIKSCIDNQVIVAHNAPFDVNVLHNAAAAYSLKLPSFKSLCTVELSRRAWPELKNHQLSTVAGSLGLDLDHHNSKSDALVCANIVMSACGYLNIKQICDCFNYLDMQSDVETFKYDRDFWDEQGFEIHTTEDQVKRQKSASKVSLESINTESKIAVINGYNVTLESCTCRDFSIRRLPCKHMYKLAQDLKVFDMSKLQQKSAENIESTACTIKININMDDIIYNVINDHTDKLLSGKIQKDEFIAGILRLVSGMKT
ncbi:exonuclease domain-containing protein [Sporomusa malonica]|uniref:SWIM zinc finger n=1 Tax=Sporomusa malonica TaxID=112901 RepID=A0A1W2AV08_9FIRM|nr:exonuclease domain-containing protein [Sporomusa malonica]SMC64370.1 SWIM zinc finger [Sporomusa malonica]